MLSQNAILIVRNPGIRTNRTTRPDGHELSHGQARFDDEEQSHPWDLRFGSGGSQ